MNKQDITVSELLPKIFNHINIAVRLALKEEFEQYTKNKCNIDGSVNEENLSSIQASSFLKIKLNTLYSRVESGEIPYSRSGKRKLLFLKSDLEQYVASRRVKSNETK